MTSSTAVSPSSLSTDGLSKTFKCQLSLFFSPVFRLYNKIYSMICLNYVVYLSTSVQFYFSQTCCMAYIRSTTHNSLFFSTSPSVSMQESSTTAAINLIQQMLGSRNFFCIHFIKEQVGVRHLLISTVTHQYITVQLRVKQPNH